MGARDASIERLMECLGHLPGIGPKSAERIAYHLLRVDAHEALQLARAIESARQAVKTCSRCFQFDSTDPCGICTDDTRDRTLLLVVEDSREVGRFEAIGYRGLYHVLQGRITELEGISIEDLTLTALLARVKKDKPIEVCLATNPDLEGEGTAGILAEKLHPLGVKVTRLARGLPAGSSITQVSTSILQDAMEGRRTLPPQ